MQFSKIIECNMEDCIFNKFGHCQALTITIDQSGKLCDVYEKDNIFKCIVNDEIKIILCFAVYCK